VLNLVKLRESTLTCVLYTAVHMATKTNVKCNVKHVLSKVKTVMRARGVKIELLCLYVQI
jgi:hypothetical protein